MESDLLDLELKYRKAERRFGECVEAHRDDWPDFCFLVREAMEDARLNYLAELFRLVDTRIKAVLAERDASK